MRSIERLHALLDEIKKDIYPEPLAEPHRSITIQVIGHLRQNSWLRPGDRVLDVGCGQGFALELFGKEGARATGITLGPDFKACVEQGLDVREMDLSFPEFDDASFDLIWCRHALEHSIFPLFTLSELRRMLVPEGLLYVEVPAPDTPCRHERNPNHYSVFGKSMWQSLFEKAGFEGVTQFDINFTVPAGPDTYWAFILRRRGR